MIRIYGLVNTALPTFGYEAPLNPGDVLVVTSQNTLRSVSGYYNQLAASSGGIALKSDIATTGQALIASPLQFTTGANQRYYVNGTIIATSSAATGIKLGLRIPSGDTGYVVFNGTDTTSLQSNASTVTTDSGLTAVYGQLSGTTYIMFSGIVSGPNARPFIIGFLKPGSGTAMLKQWSSLIWKRLY